MGARVVAAAVPRLLLHQPLGVEVAAPPRLVEYHLLALDVDGGTFPRLPFEPISKEKYDELIEIQEISGETDEEFLATLNKYDSSEWSIESVAGCTNAACIAKADADAREGKS